MVKALKKYIPRPGGTQPSEHIPTLHTRKMVGGFVCAGFNKEQIAKYFDINLDTLNRNYYRELKEEKMRRTLILSDNLFADAEGGDKDSRKFWLERQARWIIPKAREEDNKTSTDTLIEKLLEKL